MSGGKYDIIVVGAGPAGSMAAMAAASLGRRVCLLERRAKVGAPVRCGEGVGYLGLTRYIDPRPEWIKATVTRGRMVSPSGLAVDIGSGGTGFILDRERMDADLVAMAVENGAEFVPNTPVASARKLPNGLYLCESGEKSSAKNFTAPCLILADGVESRLARGFGWNTALKPRDIESCAFARVKSKNIEPDCCVFYLGSRVAPGGYVWVFPRGESEANVGLGVLGSKCSPGLPEKLLLGFIAGEFPKARISDLHCGGVPASRWVRPLVREGVMLVGDAARQVNAITGGGIAFSLFAGKAAGRAAAKSMRADGSCDHRVLTEYQRLWAAKFGKQQDRSFALKEFLESADDSFLDKVAKALLKENPNRLSYTRVFTKALASKPLLLLKAHKLFR